MKLNASHLRALYSYEIKNLKIFNSVFIFYSRIVDYVGCVDSLPDKDAVLVSGKIYFKQYSLL